MTHKTQLMGLCAGLVLALSGVVPVQAEDKATDPQQVVQVTTDKMLAALRTRHDELKKKPELIYDLVGEIVLPHFDFVRMSGWVLGKHWRTATKEQKLNFVRAFRTTMVRTYGVALLEYTDEQIRYLPLRDDLANKDVTVRTEVVRKGKPSIAINYSLHLREDGWKVYDMSVDGVSLVANYRTSFATEIKQDGMDALIKRLEDLNKKAGA